MQYSDTLRRYGLVVHNDPMPHIKMDDLKKLLPNSLYSLFVREYLKTMCDGGAHPADVLNFIEFMRSSECVV